MFIGGFWMARAVCAIALAGIVAANGFFLRDRSRFSAVMENGVLNLLMVVLYNGLCFLLTGLPSDPAVFAAPEFFRSPPGAILLPALGGVLLIGSLSLLVAATLLRRTVGAQNVKAGLLTTGVYRFFRHPIYFGIIGMSASLALIFRTWDGLLMVPVVILFNMAEAWLEERFDIGVRFAEEYAAFRKSTRMLGPIWLWGAIAAAFISIAVFA